MNYQNKYFKYKSKYLYLKSGNTSDYQHKYLKYKSKYLALKYGGAPKVDSNARDRSEWKPQKKSTTSFFGRFSLSGPKEEAYMEIEKEAYLKERTDFQIGQQQTTANLNEKKRIMKKQ